VSWSPQLAAPAATPHTSPGSTARGLGAIGVAIVACALSLGFALGNVAYFDVVNRIVGARDALPRALLFSSWLLLWGGLVVVWRPAFFGFRVGRIFDHWRLILAATVGAAAATAGLLTLVGATPYSDASLPVEVIVVPFTEELAFRGVLLTALIAVYTRLFSAPRAVILAVVANGLAFGAGHLANALSVDPIFVVQQAAFAGILGTACAALMLRTSSVYPAMLLHAAVNAVVVLI
jgi:membrane protease YdiL (CAAX protease family)